MVQVKSIAALTGLAATLINAAPANKNAFSINQIATGNRKVRSGAVEYQKALAKYGAQIPSSLRSAVEAVQSGSVPASSQQGDEEYLCPVSVGGQTLNLDFDTGSADLWVFSSETPSSEQNGQTVWDTSKGTLQQGESWSISYGDGSGASGNVYQAPVVVGGVTASAQAVEAATSVSSAFATNAADSGLLGLAFSSINTVKPKAVNTFFDNVKSTLPQPIFAVTLKYHATGSYDFGYIDSSKYTGQIAYTAVDNSQGFWGFTASGSSAGAISGSSIADTGTTLILLDDSVVSAYYAKVSGASNNAQAGGYSFPCSTTPPDFTVTISGSTLTVPGKFINFAANGDGTCFGGIQSNSGIGFNIFGDVFLKACYVVFDAGQTRLGFAQQAGVSGSGGGSPTSGGSSPTSGGGSPTSGGGSPTSGGGSPTSGGGSPTSAGGAPTSGGGSPTSAGGAPTSGGGYPSSPAGGAPSSGGGYPSSPAGGAPTSVGGGYPSSPAGGYSSPAGGGYSSPAGGGYSSPAGGYSGGASPTQGYGGSGAGGSGSGY